MVFLFCIAYEFIIAMIDDIIAKNINLIDCNVWCEIYCLTLVNDFLVYALQLLHDCWISTACYMLWKKMHRIWDMFNRQYKTHHKDHFAWHDRSCGTESKKLVVLLYRNMISPKKVTWVLCCCVITCLCCACSRII